VLLQDNTVQQVCDYAYWAYTSYIDLLMADEFEYMRTEICPGFYSDLNQAQKEIDENNSLLLSNGFLSKLTTTIHTTYKAPSWSTLVMTNW
jgi:hypothetical protein